jgi:hyperosmotically inducible protein
MQRILFSAIVLLTFACGVACRTNVSPERQMADVEIKTAIKAKLASDLKPSTLTNVGVDVTNGVVTLTGQVSSAEDKAKAEQIARGVKNVQSVNNLLQVSPAG